VKKLITKKKKNKWLTITILIIFFIIFEWAYHLNSGTYYLCGRFGNCGEVDSQQLFFVVIYFILISITLNYTTKKNMFKNKIGITSKAADWYLLLLNFFIIFLYAVLLIFISKLV